MCIFHYFNYYLPDFVTAIFWGSSLVSHFWIFVLISLRAVTNPLVGQALSLWSGSTDSKTLDHQRTNPMGYKIVRIHTKETTGTQDLASSTTSSTLCRTPYLNNKQHKNTNQIISRQDYHLTQACPSEEKQTNRNRNAQHKSHPRQSLHKPLDQP